MTCNKKNEIPFFPNLFPSLSLALVLVSFYPSFSFFSVPPAPPPSIHQPENLPGSLSLSSFHRHRSTKDTMPLSPPSPGGFPNRKKKRAIWSMMLLSACRSLTENDTLLSRPFVLSPSPPPFLLFLSLHHLDSPHLSFLIHGRAIPSAPLAS